MIAVIPQYLIIFCGEFSTLESILMHSELGEGKLCEMDVTRRC